MYPKLTIGFAVLLLILGFGCYQGDGCHLNAPVFLAQPQSQTASLGQKVTFHADYSDKSQNAGFQWLFNGTNLGTEKFSDTDLVLNSVTQSDAGTYTVIITYYGCRTQASTISVGAILTVHSPSQVSAPNLAFNPDPAATIYQAPMNPFDFQSTLGVRPAAGPVNFHR